MMPSSKDLKVDVSPWPLDWARNTSKNLCRRYTRSVTASEKRNIILEN